MQRTDLHEALVSIETYLEPALVEPAPRAWIAARLQEGRLVAIRNAFRPAFAERMHRSLDEARDWRAYEKFDEHFHYRHHNLYEPETFPDDLARCRELFDATATKSFATELSGRDCDGPLAFSASWYLPGDYSLPHTDAVGGGTAERQLAFVWHLAREWRSEWGGALFWCPRGRYLPPSFNTLVLFAVGPESYHFVAPVSPYAGGKRLAINGWWTGRSPTLPAPASGDGEQLELDVPTVEAV